MKKFGFVLVTVLMFFILGSCATNNLPNTRDGGAWHGTYAGVIPAADGPGINVKIILNANLTYSATYQYIDRGNDVFNYSGAFKWNSGGNMITLDDKVIPPYYLVGERTLTQLDLKKKVIQGVLADNYILRKQ